MRDLKTLKLLNVYINQERKEQLSFHISTLRRLNIRREDCYEHYERFKCKRKIVTNLTKAFNSRGKSLRTLRMLKL